MKTTKKLVALALSATMMASMMPIVSAAPGDDITPVESFDYAVGTDYNGLQNIANPSNPDDKYWYNKSDNYPATVTTIEKDGNADNTALKLSKVQAINDGTSGEWDFPLANSFPSTGTSVYEFYMNVSSFNTSWRFYLQNTGYGVTDLFGFHKDHGLGLLNQYVNDTPKSTGVGFVENQWYRMSLIIHADTSTYDLYIGEPGNNYSTVAIQGGEFSGTPKAIKLRNNLNEWGSPGDCYIDDCIVYEYSDTRPVPPPVEQEPGWWIVDNPLFVNNGNIKVGNNDNGGQFYDGSYTVDRPTKDDGGLYGGIIAFNAPDPTGDPFNKVLKNITFSDDSRYFFWQQDAYNNATVNTLDVYCTYQTNFYVPAGNCFPYHMGVRTNNANSEVDQVFTTSIAPREKNPDTKYSEYGVPASSYEIRLSENGSVIANVDADKWYTLATSIKRVTDINPDTGRATYLYDVYLNGVKISSDNEISMRAANLQGFFTKNNVWGEAGCWEQPYPNITDTLYTDDIYIYAGTAKQPAINFANVITAVDSSTAVEYQAPGRYELATKPIYEIADTSIATVDADGNVTGVKNGRTSMKVTIPSLSEQTVVVTVGGPNDSIFENITTADVTVDASGNKAITLSTDISNYSGDRAELTLFAARVDANGIIQDGTVQTVTEWVLNNDNTTYTMASPITIEAGSTDKVVMFVWDGLGTLSPITYKAAYGIDGWEA